MKILKLLIKKLIILFFFLFINQAFSNEPVDIWNTNEKKNEEVKIENNDEMISNQNTQSVDQTILVQEDQNITAKEKLLFGIYDPAENDLSLNMWEKSNKDKVIKLINKLNKLNLSQDAKKIYNKVILTNTFVPDTFTKNEFLKLKIDWLVKNKDLKLIDQFILNNNNQIIDANLLNFYLDDHLAEGDLENACKVFDIITFLPDDIYTSKFQIYCLIYKNKNELAQVQYDLLKENNFEDKLFESQFNYLMGYSKNKINKISENKILDFHLSRITNEQFVYEPNEATKKNIWRYLNSFNLLKSLDEVDIENDEKIISIEIETHNNNYSEKDLLNLYTRYRFSIQQLIDIESSYNELSENQSRALLYQGILLAKDDSDKIKFLQILKESFKKSKIENAFNMEFIKILEQINRKKIPDKYKYFYDYYLTANNKEIKKIKFNNKILHQSKLIGYFLGDMKIETSEKELNKMLKKIKKNKKYFFSLEDKIIVESLISDGIKISEKEQELLELNTANIPTDIEVMINDSELAVILLRLVEIIGEDNLKDLGTETIYFIITTLNKLNVDKIRNEIILNVIPLKV